jgi:hypothetical protein
VSILGGASKHQVDVQAPSGKVWCIDTHITKETADFWRKEGLTVWESVNTIPKWWVDIGGSVRLWCFVQDVLRFKNPWEG